MLSIAQKNQNQIKQIHLKLIKKIRKASKNKDIEISTIRLLEKEVEPIYQLKK